MNEHIVLNMHSKIPGGNIGIILALLKSIKKGKTKC